MTGESAPGLPGPTPENLEAFRQNYLAAFLRYLARRDETALHDGYELGRSAVAGRLGLLEVARVHHDVFLHVLSTVSAEELADVGTAASEFFLEVLATYDMAQKVFLDGPDQDAP
jgi:hypothetical protein